MGIENVIDAIGLEVSTGVVVLSLMDSADWANERQHLHDLQNKLNAYFAFIEGGEILDVYPDAKDRPLRIDVLWRAAPTQRAVALVEQARIAAKSIDVEIAARTI